MQEQKNNILHVINSFEVGGAEILLENIARHFNVIDQELILAYCLGTGYVLKNSNRQFKIYNISKDGKFSLFSIFKIIKIIKLHRVKIVHTHDPQSGIIARIAAFVCGVKIIISTRHNPDLIGSHPLVYMVENYLLKKNDGIIAISKAVEQRLIKHYRINKKIIKIIPNSIDLSLFNLDQKKNDYEIKNIKICTVARLIPQKGVDILIHAFKLFISKKPLSVLLIVGDGSERKSLELLVKTLELNEKVLFLGKIDQDQVIRTLREIDLFVLASRWEGFGISLIEAMAMHKPVIGSDVDGISEIIEHGINGLLFQNGNYQSLSELMNIVIENNKLRQDLSENARKTVISKYSIEQYCYSLAEEYRDHLKGKVLNGKR